MQVIEHHEHRTVLSGTGQKIRNAGKQHVPLSVSVAGLRQFAPEALGQSRDQSSNRAAPLSNVRRQDLVGQPRHQLDERLHPRFVRNTQIFVTASVHDHGTPVVDIGSEPGGQRRLADPRLTGHQHHTDPNIALAVHCLPGRFQALVLDVAAHEVRRLRRCKSGR